ncbi:MAG: hypothetical protein AAF570_00690, partial [Bacteroidota bacterium]
MHRIPIHIPPFVSQFALALCLAVLPLLLSGQPVNDNCVNAEVINITNGGFDFGTFSSSAQNMTNATLELGENFPAGVPNAKSIWFRFSLPTTREVRIVLLQSGVPVLNPTDGGWVLYRTNSCLPAAGDVINPPIQNIEGFTHECLRAGDYLIQVGIDLGVNGNLGIDLEVAPVDPNNADIPYDYANAPYDFQIASGINLFPARLNHFYEVACQSIFDLEGTCNDPDYTKSTWHVFSTDAHVDYFRFEVGENPFSPSNPSARNWYYNLFQGDIRVDSLNLTRIDSCKTLTQVSATSYGACFYTCELQPNTTYSVQLLHPTSYFARINTRVYEMGAQPTISPNPNTIPASHQLGTLSNGSPVQVTDYFACNGLTSNNVCGTAVTDSIYFGATPYDLNFWTTFTVPFSGNVNFDLTHLACGPTTRGRIFQGDVGTGGCNLPIDTTFSGDFTYNCMPPGTYSLQILGRVNEATALSNPCSSNLADSIRLALNFSQPAAMNFGLFTPIEIENIHGLAPLEHDSTYIATQDFFDCRTTFMPAGQPCAASYNRAIYRRFVLSQTGAVRITGGNFFLQYSLFAGDASTAPIVGNQIQGLTDVSGCRNYLPFTVCLPAGTYTLVTYGDDSDVARGDQPRIEYAADRTEFGMRGPGQYDELNGGAPLSNGVVYTAVTDTFDCDVTPLPAQGCAGYDRAIYRIFTLSQGGTLTLTGSGHRYRLYQGGVDTTAQVGSLFPNLVPETSCLSLGVRTICVDPGRYTLVAFGNVSDQGQIDRPTVQLNAITTQLFDLDTPQRIDSINGGAGLVSGTTYNSTYDQFDCDTTVMPAGDHCGAGNDRAIYRYINITTSGILVVDGGVWPRFRYRLYRGDASSLPIVGGEIQGLVDQAGCQSTFYAFKVCVTPGIYTLVTFGDPNDLGFGDNPWVHFESFPPTSYTDPAAPEILPNLNPGNPIVAATPTRFNCDDNPLDILGNSPCSNATKQVYREFFLDQTYCVSFRDRSTGWFSPATNLRHRLFSGRISTGPDTLSAMVRNCSDDWTMCLDSGWYTVVTYGFGETFVAPDYTSGLGGSIGEPTWFELEIDTDFQRYGSFAEADTVNGGPIFWEPDYGGGHTAAVPRNFKTYILDTEYWDCVDNLPFETGITPCLPSHNRVSYRVFELTRPSYVYIYNLNQGGGKQSRLYDGDITANPAPYTVLTDCITDQIRICLQPGWYTLATFAGDAHIKQSLTPRIYLDSLGISKYDHAANAYDFGNVPPTNTAIFQNPADSPDALGRPQSNDFFFCTTGAQPSDTINVCPIGTPPPGSALPNPTRPRRNLWYTFTLTNGGQATVTVNTLTPGKTARSPFAVYRGPNVAIPPVDSTNAQGLTFIGRSTTIFCNNATTVTFNRNNCLGTTDRYYILVDNYSTNEPNTQIQVSVRYNPLAGTTADFDHYSTANVIDTTGIPLCAPPYNLQPLPLGTWEGCLTDLTCYTQDPTDQNTCGTKTAWYKFEADR